MQFFKHNRIDEVMRLGVSEYEAVVAGVSAAEAALDRTTIVGLLQLFDYQGQKHYGDATLDLLRDYAELRRALLDPGRTISAQSLEAAGYSSRQIGRIDALIDTLAAGRGPPPVYQDHTVPILYDHSADQVWPKLS